MRQSFLGVGDRTEWKKRGRIREKVGERGQKDQSAGCRASWQMVMEGLSQCLHGDKGASRFVLCCLCSQPRVQESLCSGLGSGAHLLLCGGQGVLNDGLDRLHPSFQKEIGML